MNLLFAVPDSYGMLFVSGGLASWFVFGGNFSIRDGPHSPEPTFEFHP